MAWMEPKGGASDKRTPSVGLPSAPPTLKSAADAPTAPEGTALPRPPVPVAAAGPPPLAAAGRPPPPAPPLFSTNQRASEMPTMPPMMREPPPTPLPSESTVIPSNADTAPSRLPPPNAGSPAARAASGARLRRCSHTDSRSALQLAGHPDLSRAGRGVRPRGLPRRQRRCVDRQIAPASIRRRARAASS